jgi:DNA-binding NarL/FixJ family response regulator
MTATIHVVIADDHPVTVEGIKNVLATQPSIAVVGLAENFGQVPAVLAQTRPDVLILDLTGMGNTTIALMQRLERDFPTVGVVIFSSALNYANELLDHGVRGYVTKTELASDLIRAVTAVARGEICLSPLVEQYLGRTGDNNALTPRELFALRMEVQGLRTQQMAEIMQIRSHSVQNLFNSMFAKTGCRTRRELAEWYIQLYGPLKEDNQAV